MLECFTEDATASIPILLITPADYPQWLAQQSPAIQTWLNQIVTTKKKAQYYLIPDETGSLQKVIVFVDDATDRWAIAHLPQQLPQQNYYLENIDSERYFSLALGWGCGSYQYSRYKKATSTLPKLVIDKKFSDKLYAWVETIYITRDLINTPACDLGPNALAEEAKKLARQFEGDVTEWIGDQLVTDKFYAIHAVGRAAAEPPRFLHLRFGQESQASIAIIGKGVTFDTGGLDIKSHDGMLTMRKDMAGAAYAMALTRLLMKLHLPYQIHLLLPLVENAISENAFRPGDVINTHKGLTVEITNTDAEGRLILCDALNYASQLSPQMIFDFATLTGSARVATGTELPVFFCNNDGMAEAIMTHAKQVQDYVWRLPLFMEYRDMLNSSIADLKNCPLSGYGGAITAALFLNEFVDSKIPWLHMDMMAWNLKSKPGRPEGGEVQGLIGIFNYLVNAQIA